MREIKFRGKSHERMNWEEKSVLVDVFGMADIDWQKIEKNREDEKERLCKFKNNERVFIGDLPLCMSHFPSHKEATVIERKASSCIENPHTYGLDIDGVGKVWWYPENVLSLIKARKE